MVAQIEKCVLLALVLGVIYFVSDPLRKVPGPFGARISRLWLLRHELAGHRSRKIHELHQKYGNVVRIGPRQVSFASQQAVRDIYGANNKLIKAPVYEAFGRPSSFTIRNREAHRARQKRIAHMFAPAAIAAVEGLVQEKVKKLLQRLSERASQPIDMMEWFRIFALEVVGAVFLGKSFGGLEDGKAPQILHDLDEVFPSLWMEWQFASVRPVLLLLPIKALARFLEIGPNFYNYGRAAFDEYVSINGRSGDRRDLLTKLLRGNKEYGPLQDDEIVNEMTNLIFAGTDTTSNTLSYMLYELARLPRWQIRLHAELDQVATFDVPDYKTVSNLPVLNAVIHETLRFHPAAPASLQRLSPEQNEIVIDDVAIPPQTIVSCQAYTTQRDPMVFHNPDEFKPERWLDVPDNELIVMHDRIMVWGKGQRSCLGKQLAYMELKVTAAAILNKFSIDIGNDTTEDDMEMTDQFTLIAKGQRCILLLQKREVEPL